MTVALDDLGGNRIGAEPQPGTNRCFVFGLEMAEGTYRARQFAHTHVFCARIEAGEVALDLGIPVQQFQAERRRFGVDAVRAANGWSVLKLERALAENACKRENSLANQGGRFFDLERLGSIHYIVGS